MLVCPLDLDHIDPSIRERAQRIQRAGSVIAAAREFLEGNIRYQRAHVRDQLRIVRAWDRADEGYDRGTLTLMRAATRTDLRVALRCYRAEQKRLRELGR